MTRQEYKIYLIKAVEDQDATAEKNVCAFHVKSEAETFKKLLENEKLDMTYEIEELEIKQEVTP